MEGVKSGGGGGGGKISTNKTSKKKKFTLLKQFNNHYYYIIGFDIFEQFFGGGGRAKRDNRPRKGKTVLKELKVTLEDVYNGKLFKIPHTRKKLCEECDGKGGKVVSKCSSCKGRGMIEKNVMLGPGMYQVTSQPCHECRGEGTSVDAKDRCKTCKGNKVIEEKKTLEVSVEPGVPHEFDYVITGEGDEYVYFFFIFDILLSFFFFNNND